MDDVRRSVDVLAARVRDAHAARVWLPLGFASWQVYCAAEFGISRALRTDWTGDDIVRITTENSTLKGEP